MTGPSLALEISAKKIFPSQFRISAEQRLMNFCTNEIGTILLDSQQSDINNTNHFTTALIGNPIRILHLDGHGHNDNKPLNFTGSATAIEQNCIGKYLAMATGTTLSVFDLHKDTILREFHDHDEAVTDVAWHWTSPWLLSSVGADCTLRFWDLRSHPAQIAFRRTARPCRRLEYSPDCNYIACAGQIVSIYNINYPQPVIDMPNNFPTIDICFNPAVCLLATSSEDRVVRFWDIDTGECVSQSPAFDSSVGHMRFAPDGQFLIVNSAQQISCIHWEPYELFAQLPYSLPIQMAANSQLNWQSSGGPQINLLDMCIQNGILHQLAIYCNDPAKNSTACLTSIDLEHLKKCAINNFDCNKESVSEDSIPTYPTSITKPIPPAANEENVKDFEEDDISPGSLSTSTAVDSMLDSLTTTIRQPHQMPSKKARPIINNTTSQNRKKSTNVGVLKRGTSSTEIGIIGTATPLRAGDHHFTRGTTTKIQQKRSSLADGGIALNHIRNRPNRLPINDKNSHSSGRGPIEENNSRDIKSLIRRGSSLNDVTDASSHNDINTKNIKSHAMTTNAKNRSLSQAQSSRQQKFSSSFACSSSTASSSAASSLSSNDPPAGQHASVDVEEEHIEELIQSEPKIHASIEKQKAEINALLMSVASRQGKTTTEFIVEKTAQFEDLYPFAQLLDDYIQRPMSYTMGLNAAFLSRVHALITHRNEHYVQLALDFLDMVTTRFGDSIRHGLASRDYTIGVDVAAEQRFERCTKCKNALFQIRLNSAFHKERMNRSQLCRFENEVIPRIDSLISSISIPSKT